MDSLSQHTVISCQDLSIGYQNKKKVAVIASAVVFLSLKVPLWH